MSTFNSFLRSDMLYYENKYTSLSGVKLSLLFSLMPFYFVN